MTAEPTQKLYNPLIYYFLIIPLTSNPDLFITGVRSFRVTPHPSVHPGIMLSDPEAVTELCAPPLRAITLQLEDKANLTDWLSLLWPAAGKQGGQISPDHFQWFSYRDKALGYKMDLLAETFSNGKILLGSYMKKPLLVDHSATTVSNPDL
uniref:Uncharacterized protein n=1 Tax=Hucho hucho TaxID=62062 RepID=A0A4W5L202_9TELE